MKRKPALILALVCVAALAAAYGIGQGEQTAEGKKVLFLAQLHLAELNSHLLALKEDLNQTPTDEVKLAPQKVQEALRKAADDPELTAALLAYRISEFEDGHVAAKSAAQESQISGEMSVKLQMQIVEQNQRIITLLEKIAKTKP